MTDWVRLWHDMPTDPKWRVIARKSGQPLPCVIAVFTMMMTNASANAEARGTLTAWDDEDAGAALDMDAAAVSAIRAAMSGKVLDGDRLTGWERRQPKREDGTAAERKAAWKERKQQERNALERIGTHWNAPETETETDIPLSKDNGADALFVDPEKVMFDTGISMLVGQGKSAGQARSLIGKWRKTHSAGDVIEMLGAAQRLNIVDIPAWAEARWRTNGRVMSDAPLC